MVNYGNGKIYKIEPVCEHDEGDIYIGSTTKEYLSQRMDTHRNDYKRWLNGKRNKVMSFQLFDKYSINNCQIVLLESVRANTKDELASREAYYIRHTKCLNKNIPGRTHKQYCEQNKQAIVEYHRQYYEQNKDVVAEKGKQYYEQNKESISERHKIYRDINKAKRNAKCTCECGGCFTNGNRSTHFKTKQHQNYINFQNQFEYYWDDGTPCTEQDYYASLA